MILITVDQLFNLVLYVWLLAAIGLVIRLKVFSPQALRTAPGRPSAFSLQIFAGIFLLYIAASVLTLVSVNTFFRNAPPPAVSETVLRAPASGPATTSAPAATSVAVVTSAPAATTSAPATSTAPAMTSTAPATMRARDFSAEILEQSATLIGELIPCLVILFLASRIHVGGLDGFGISLRKIPSGLRFGLLGFLITYPLLLAIGNAVDFVFEQILEKPQEIHPTMQLLAAHPTVVQKVLLIFFAGVCAPILEEIAFRGLLQSTLAQRRWGLILPNAIDTSYRASPAHRWGAIVVTALFFAAVHGLPEHIPLLFTLAVALGYLYERTGNLWTNITLHAAFNLTNIYFLLYAG